MPALIAIFTSAWSASAVRKTLRLATGLVLLLYVTMHLANHALGLISLDTAEAALRVTVVIWQSLPGTVLLYGAAFVHFLMALWAVYERRTFRLPPGELLRITLGFALPILLIGHVAATRLAYELYALAPDYSRVVANLWVSDAQGRQLGLLAPGWLHGCLGLHFAFHHRPFYQRIRLGLFAGALLLPTLSALGFVAMGRHLSEGPAAAAASFQLFSPTYAAQRTAIASWRDGMIVTYCALIAAAFGARTVRNAIERGRDHLISIAYPGRTLRVPRGWSVLEASRSFHLPHAAMCGGRARCSTCRVRVIAGDGCCPPPKADEQRILAQINAPTDIRLACQLRPLGDVSVIPLVRTERPNYQLELQERTAEQDIVVLVCDLVPADRSGACLAQDYFYGISRYIEALAQAVRVAGGTISSADTESLTALFGLATGTARGAAQALNAGDAIKAAVDSLDQRIGLRSRVRVKVAIHAGRAVLGAVDVVERPATLAVGAAIELTNEIRRAASTHDRMFAISQPVYDLCGTAPAVTQQIDVRTTRPVESVIVHLSQSVPVPSSEGAATRQARTAIRRLWRRR
ncbi:MAG: 2Fe-2S iron-sulfur cluster binding domain-containing protein [Hyphomicrobiales bacterium]|nr:2Fe-2S iron-sulfur cluster binding domain-containing protein [Hyphomicrobiales bacterium]